MRICMAGRQCAFRADRVGPSTEQCASSLIPSRSTAGD